MCVLPFAGHRGLDPPSFHSSRSAGGGSPSKRHSVPGVTSDPHLLRRVARLENDRDSLYELVDDFRAEVRARFDQVDARLDQHGARLDQHSARLDQHDARFDRIDARFDQHDARFDQHDVRFDRIDGTLAEVLRRLPEPPEA